MLIFELIFRADYWKSKERKYCEFCKCWLGDDKMVCISMKIILYKIINKILFQTLSIHENGKRHKDNVAKKLSTIQKKSAKQYKNNLKVIFIT